MNAVFWFWIIGQQVSDSNAFVNFRPEHGKHSFLQSRSNPSAVTSGVRAQFQLLEDIRENTTIKISPN